jgi:hypothetical protein
VEWNVEFNPILLSITEWGKNPKKSKKIGSVTSQFIYGIVKKNQQSFPNGERMTGRKIK